MSVFKLAWVVGSTGDTVGDWYVTRPLTVGRAEDNDIVINNPTVSRKHFTVTPCFDEPEYVRLDVQSAHGVYVHDSVKITTSILLVNSAMLRIGNVLLTLTKLHTSYCGIDDKPTLT